MDRRLRRAPDAEWVLMYRLRLSRKRIAELVRVHPAVIGYHVVIARRQEPGLEVEHHAAAGARPGLSPTDLARMEEVIAWVTAEGRLREGRSPDRGERRGDLDPVKVKLLDDAVPGWQTGRTRGRPPRR